MQGRTGRKIWTGQINFQGRHIMKGGTLLNDRMCWLMVFSDQEIITCCGRKVFFSEANSVNTWLMKIVEILKVNMIILQIFHHGGMVEEKNFKLLKKINITNL